MYAWQVAALAAVSGIASGQVNVVAESTFDTDLDGWSALNGDPPNAFDGQWDPMGGNPGGGYTYDLNTQFGLTSFDNVAPDKFNGDWFDLGPGARFSFDWYIELLPGRDLAIANVILQSIDESTGQITAQGLYEFARGVGSDRQWRTFTIDDFRDRMLSSGSLVGLLSEVDRVRIQITDSRFRTNHDGAIDNVRLFTVPLDPASDDFNAAFTYADGPNVTPGGIWDGVSFQANANSVTAGNNGDELWIDVNGSFSSSNPQNDPPFDAPNLWRDAAGDFVATVEIDPTTPDEDFENLGLAIWWVGPPTINSAVEVLSIFNSTFGSTTRFRAFDDGSLVDGENQDPALYTWLRLERRNGLLRGSASFDGENWVTLGTRADYTPNRVRLGLFAASANTSGDFTAKFDNFSFTPTPECTVADLALPFGTLDLGDIDAYIAAFLAGDALADVAAPFGVLDLGDTDAFIAAFFAGCP